MRCQVLPTEYVIINIITTSRRPLHCILFNWPRAPVDLLTRHLTHISLASPAETESFDLFRVGPSREKHHLPFGVIKIHGSRVKGEYLGELLSMCRCFEVRVCLRSSASYRRASGLMLQPLPVFMHRFGRPALNPGLFCLFSCLD